MSNSELTIVIPVYNRAAIVGRTLDSVHAQTLRPLSVVLVDNNSTDNSLEVLDAWKQAVETHDFKVTVITETTPGPSAARNAGLSQVTTEWTMFFDSDDVMLPDHAARAMRTAHANPDADIINWPVEWFNEVTEAKRHKPARTKNLSYFNTFVSLFTTQSYMARTELFRRVGGWGTGLSMGEDAELGQRLLAAGAKVAITDGAYTLQVMTTEGSLMSLTENRVARIVASLTRLKENLPDNQKHWADLQLILWARTWGKDDPESPVVVEQIIGNTKGMRRRLWRFFDWYTRHGGRAVWLLYFPLRNLI